MGEFEHKEFSDEFIQEGWMQMRQLLDKEAPTHKRPFPFFLHKHRTSLIISLLLLVFLGIGYFISQDTPGAPALADDASVATGKEEYSKHHEPVQLPENAGTSSAEENPAPIAPAKMPATGKSLVENKHSEKLLPARPDGSVVETLMQATFADGIHQPRGLPNMPATEQISSAPPVFNPPPGTSEGKQTKKPSLLKPVFSAGFAINFSGKHQLSLQNPSIYPALGLSLPVGGKLTFDVGIGLFSSVNRIHDDGVSKEYLNNPATNIQYKLYTTKVIKVKYIDLPLSLNYHFSSGFFAGAGIDVSRLYRSKINEQVESYNFDNELELREQNTFYTDANTLGAPSRQALQISNWDTRLIAQGGWRKGHLKITASYHHGLNDAVQISQPYGIIKGYKNTLINLNIQYLIQKK